MRRGRVRRPVATIGAPRPSAVAWSEPTAAPATLWPDPGQQTPIGERTNGCACRWEGDWAHDRTDAAGATVGIAFEQQSTVGDRFLQAHRHSASTPLKQAVAARRSELVVQFM